MLAIKGVPMPTTCENCMFGRPLMDTLGDAYCAIFPTLPTQVGVRPDWCPLEDVPPRMRGKWIWKGEEGDSRFSCSVCKCRENVPTCNGIPDIWDYCPNCGCQMNGDEEDEQ